RCRSEQCRRSEVPAPRAASSSQELQIESGTRIICLLVPLCFRSLCQTVPRCITNFGNGALATGYRHPAAILAMAADLVHVETGDGAPEEQSVRSRNGGG